MSTNRTVAAGSPPALRGGRAACPKRWFLAVALAALQVSCAASLQDRLQDAVGRHDGGALREVLAAGPVQARDATAALRHAVEGGDAEATEILLEHGADIKARSLVAGQSLLERAFRRGEKPEALARILVAHGADVNERWTDGDLSLRHAVWEGTALTGSFLDHGAKVNERTLDGRTALAWAVRVALEIRPGSTSSPCCWHVAPIPTCTRRTATASS